MRDLWFLAVGRYDAEMSNRNFLRAMHGLRPWTEEELDRFHPLRALEAPPPPKANKERVARTLDRLFSD